MHYRFGLLTDQSGVRGMFLIEVPSQMTLILYQVDVNLAEIQVISQRLLGMRKPYIIPSVSGLSQELFFFLIYISLEVIL